MEDPVSGSGIMRDASRRAQSGGEWGLLPGTHLQRFPHLTSGLNDKPYAEAKPPSRDAPIFKKHIVTGRTYRTANGATVPSELQYYDGEMVHFYGECLNVWAVNQGLAGSGYQPVRLAYPDGRETAVAHVWSSRFTDTTIGPYNAMFIVIMAVPLGADSGRATLRADRNGASSVLPMLDGTFDAATAVYENTARLFMVRLLDTTRVAIDVGRERMGTDKRPGTVDMSCHGRWLSVSIRDQAGRGVITAYSDLAGDAGAYTPEVAKAAATAGIPLRALPRDTEYVYPAVARIGHGPVVRWQWRSDLVPRLQAVVPGTVVLDPSADEGRLLLSWGFTPRVLGYIPNVRGVVTGLADPASVAPAETMGPASSWPRDEAVTISRSGSVRLFRTGVSGEPAQAGGQMPVLQLVPQALSPDFGGESSGAADAERLGTGPAGAAQPRWAWNTSYLGSLRAMLRKEVVGPTPDGLRINWYVTTGTFVGPGLNATVLPGAADWMRIRRDGVAIVSVQACFEAGDDRVRVYGSYSGMFDLGPDGYARALRDEYDQLPPVVVTPTYLTADPRFAWLNRSQFIGVGRVDMSALRVEFDVYVVRVGGRASLTSAVENETGDRTPRGPS